MAKNILRMDPSRTTMLRKAFARDIKRRLRELSAAIQKLIVEDDVFGLKRKSPLAFNVEPLGWSFHTSDQKLVAFQKWFKKQVDKGLLSVGPGGDPWTHKYVESAYKKGALRAYTDVHKDELLKKPDFYRGTKEQFLRSSFETSERISKVRLLSLRTFEELKGITATMSVQLARALSDGIANGYGAQKIAREMTNAISGISRKRALVIARTELIHAHAEGQLDAFEDLGVEEVGILAEFRTAGDERVCPICQALEGVVLTINEARGVIPVHPNCRCAWVPALRRHRRIGQIWAKAEKKKVLAKARLLARRIGRKKVVKKKGAVGDVMRRPGAVPDFMKLSADDPLHPRNLDVASALNKTRPHVQKIRESLGSIDVPYAREINDLKTEIRRLKVATGGPDWAAIDSLSAKSRLLQKEREKALRGVFSYDSTKGSKVMRDALEKQGKIGPNLSRRIDDAADRLGDMMSDKVADSLSYGYIQQGPLKGGRAFFSDVDRTINLSSFTKVEQVAHEMGHWIDVAGGRGFRARKFFRKRTAGLKSKAYKRTTDEFVIKDKFVSEYVGKVYSDPVHSEIVSMGIEMIMKDPIRFAKRDFEHFNFVVSYLRGWL